VSATVTVRQADGMREGPQNVRTPPAWYPTAARRRTRITYSRGYHITRAILNTTFAIAALGLAVLLLGPVAYGLGV